MIVFSAIFLIYNDLVVFGAKSEFALVKSGFFVHWLQFGARCSHNCACCYARAVTHLRCINAIISQISSSNFHVRTCWNTTEQTTSSSSRGLIFAIHDVIHQITWLWRDRHLPIQQVSCNLETSSSDTFGEMRAQQ